LGVCLMRKEMILRLRRILVPAFPGFGLGDYLFERVENVGAIVVLFLRLAVIVYVTVVSRYVLLLSFALVVLLVVFLLVCTRTRLTVYLSLPPESPCPHRRRNLGNLAPSVQQ